MAIIEKNDVVFAAIDFQEKLLPAMKDPEALETTVIKLIKGIRSFRTIPVIVTQQYTKGLGPTTAPVAEALGDFEPIDKTSFSALGQPAFTDALEATGRKTVLVCGIECHICVLQTVVELISRGYRVYVAQDCVASRKESDSRCGLERMAAAGAVITTYESILYELLREAKAENFKEISAIVK